jgi:hypothetical protein
VNLFETLPEEECGAVLSPCRTYRYHLWRSWDTFLPTMAWIMLNPSTADADTDDPTIRRCIGFAKREGCGGISVRNVFALRAPDPSELSKHTDPFGPDNEKWLLMTRFISVPKLILAWGAKKGGKRLLHHYRRVENIFRSQSPYCFGTTTDGDPRHPLYLPNDANMEPF